MAEDLRKQLGRHGVGVSSFEAKRCYAARELFDPLVVCKKWKAAEKTLMQSATTKSTKEVMKSEVYEVGLAGRRNAPCVILHARHQNPAGHERSATLLSTLWACDAAIASQQDGDAKLTVGYDFAGAGIRNFSLDHALPFSRLFLYEYPCLVSDVYLIGMPWVLRQLMPLFQPLVSRNVRLVSVDSSYEFEKAVGYKPIVGPGESFAAHAEEVVPRAAAWLDSKSSSALAVQSHQRNEPEQAIVDKSVFDFVGTFSSGFGLAVASVRRCAELVAPIGSSTALEFMCT